jgi:hemoglobin-like flavoprotein
MTPEQIAIVETTIMRARSGLVEIAADFYGRLFEAEPGLRGLFTSDPAEQCRKLAEQLDAIACGIRDCDGFVADATDLGIRHCFYGVEPRHYALAGPPLLASLAAALGPEWTDAVEAAWLLAYNLMVEAMMAGAADGPSHPPAPRS